MTMASDHHLQTNRRRAEGQGKPPPDAARPRRRTGAESKVELAGHDERNGTALLVRGGGAQC